VGNFLENPFVVITYIVVYPEQKTLMMAIYGSIKIFSNNNYCSFGEEKMQVLHDPFLNYN